MSVYRNNIIYLLPLLKIPAKDINIEEIIDCKLVKDKLFLEYDYETIKFPLPTNINRMIYRINTNPERFNEYLIKLVLKFWTPIDSEITSYLKNKYHESYNRKHLR